jgi:hypothetical protein
MNIAKNRRHAIWTLEKSVPSLGRRIEPETDEPTAKQARKNGLVTPHYQSKPADPALISGTERQRHLCQRRSTSPVN